MSTSSAVSTAAGGTGQWKYDVFVNFRGADIRRKFLGHLQDALVRAELKTFIDEDLRRGKDISELFEAIEDSKVAVAIFSEDYASSPWCLDELVKIIESWEYRGQTVIPVFYDVGASVVQEQSGTYAEAFAKHQNNSKNARRVPIWKGAMTKAAKIAGIEARKTRNEAILVEKIVNEILIILGRKSDGMDRAVKTEGSNNERSVSSSQLQAPALIEHPKSRDGDNSHLQKDQPHPTPTKKESKELDQGSGPESLISVSSGKDRKGNGDDSSLPHTESNEIEVHDMLQEMGRQIFFEESEEPSTHIISKLLPSKKGKKISKVITVPPAQAAPVKSDKRPKSVEMRSLYSEEEEEDIGNATQVIVNLQPLPPPFRTQLRRLMTMDEAGVETEKAVKGRSNIGPEPISGPEECTRKLKLLGLQDAKNEAAPSIGSGTGQHQSKASSAGTEPEIADIQHKPMQSGGTRKRKLEQPQDAENEVASSIGSGIDQHQCKALSLGTEPKIADIQHEPMQSGILSSLTQIDGPSKMLPEATLKCMGLPTPPECEEWQISTEIYLMDNEFSELPENLSCPTLKALFLNRNFRLRKIPESFFNNMPALHTLNISRTRIKSLPQSLFELVNLKKLFLNHCELLMKLQPEIGKLRNLETLDLEGTRITNLPSEVQHLTTLTCLKLSFDDPVNHKKELLNEVIPGGVFSALTKLKELHIDVSPNDKRWNACVVAIACEVRGLTTLDTLEFYFPCVELLSCFNWYNTEGESLSLSHFIFTVGHHIKRIMSRTPHNLELEMEQYDKCLKYVNGAGIPEEIKMVLRYATAFFLDRHTDITTLSEFGYENMMQLKWCLIGECNEIEAIINGDQMGSCSFSLTALEYLHIYRMKNLRSICEGRVLSNEFTSLRILTLRTCPRLTTIFAAELLTSFSNLEEIFVDDCPIISSIVSCYNSEYEATHFLPKLKKISLQHLPALASISNTNGISMPPTVEWMSFYCCPNLLRLPINKGYHTSLKKIEGERSWWEALEWRSTQQRSWDDIFVPINVCD